MINFFSNKRLLTLSIVFFFGSFLFLYGLGSTGLIDETPPLFASAGRAMSHSNDWLTPKVNGILRFDKPPFFYWLMAIFYSIPNNAIWDEFGSLSARLPSALSALILMIMIADTIYCSTQSINDKITLSLIASLGFAISPLIIIWSRTAVSDSLLCMTLGVSLLSFWRKISSNQNNICITPWCFLGFAILTKGPVALVIIFSTLFTFSLLHENWKILFQKINPLRGILISFLISFPWYIVQFINNGKVFWDNFFGYHNLQRYTSVVNNHSEPWWFFIFIMILASLPFSVFLIHGIIETSKEIIFNLKSKFNQTGSIYIYSLCWLLSVLLFFSISATKLTSYWIPAIPAASILITKSTQVLNNKKNISLIWLFTSLILFGFSLAFYYSDNWLVLLKDPEMPDLANQIKDYGLILRAKILFTISTFISIFLMFRSFRRSFLFFQIFLLVGQFSIMMPIRKLADQLRQEPLRNISKKIINIRSLQEPLAMIGIRKPSLHFYSKQIVFYESSSQTGLVNLYERFNNGKRRNELDQPNYSSDSFLVVIDRYSKKEKHWTNIKQQQLGVFGIYSLIRVNRNELNLLAKEFKSQGVKPTWENEKYEKF